MQLSGEYAQTYQIIGQIGEGGGGTIYKAFHTRLQKYVVLKKIHENGNYDINTVRREADILKNLRHSYLPQVFDFLILDSGVYTVMDFIAGQSLQEILKSGYHFTEKEIVKYGTQLSEALAYLHAQHPAIIHGDIKPANIMITPQGNVCLIDFNISGVADASQKAYVYGYSEGYAAPEQYQAYMQIMANRQKNSSVLTAYAGTEILTPQNATELLQNSNATEILYSSNATEILQKSNRTEMLQNNNMTGVPQSGNATEILQVNHGQAMPQQNVQQQQSVMKGIPVDTRSDVYSLAATLYRMLTGYTINPQNPQIVTTNASEGFCIILNKALSMEPGKRYQDAGKMLEAFRNVYKLDKRYRRIVLRQQIAEMILIVLIAAGVGLALLGKEKMADEKIARYEACISEMEASRENDHEEEFETAYEEACRMFPNDLRTYYQKALYLVEQNQYEEGIEYISNEILGQVTKYESAMIADVYYLLGRCYFELDAYENAADSYQNAIKNYGQNSNYYIEYAISLARMDHLDLAQQTLEQAQELGVSDELVYLTKGEIDLALGEYQSAYENFIDCIDTTSDDYIRLRAYLICSKIYDDQAPDADNYAQQITLLEKARVSLPLEYQSMLLQRLAQAYINYGMLTDDNGAYQSAIEVLNQIIDYGWGSFPTYSNIVVLYERSGDYESAKAVLDSIEADNTENYAFYKRKAFLEVDMQQQYDQSSRNYDAFLEYYTTAVQLYEKSNDNSDTEMLLLDNMYQQLVDGGWL